MSKSDALEAWYLNLILNAVPIPNMADDAATGPLTNLYVSLHTDDPTDSGDQTTHEATYTGYARVPVVRNAAVPGWTLSGVSPTKAHPVANIDFPMCTAGLTPEAHPYFAIGREAAGVGSLLYVGQIDPIIYISNGVTPRLTPASFISED